MASNLVCYCFGYTTQDAQVDFKANGTATIME